MRGSLLHVAQRDPGIQRGGDERVPQRVGRDGLADPGAACDLRTIRPAPWEYADCLVLGDSLAILAGQAITDDRLSQVSPDIRERYRERLAEGHGYDQQHRQLLRNLQQEQARQRNRPGGYWIAETDPAAADHALVTRSPADSVPWAVLATDGAYKTMPQLGITNWSALHNASDQDLADILARCQSWEASEDPDGQKLPRAKRHDDKTLAVAELSRS